jgi:hypothetical protein
MSGIEFAEEHEVQPTQPSPSPPDAATSLSPPPPRPQNSATDRQLPLPPPPLIPAHTVCSRACKAKVARARSQKPQALLNCRCTGCQRGASHPGAAVAVPPACVATLTNAPFFRCVFTDHRAVLRLVRAAQHPVTSAPLPSQVELSMAELAPKEPGSAPLHCPLAFEYGARCWCHTLTLVFRRRGRVLFLDA